MANCWTIHFALVGHYSYHFFLTAGGDFQGIEDLGSQSVANVATVIFGKRRKLPRWPSRLKFWAVKRALLTIS